VLKRAFKTLSVTGVVFNVLVVFAGLTDEVCLSEKILDADSPGQNLIAYLELLEARGRLAS
jgi:hypothetical protein